MDEYIEREAAQTSCRKYSFAESYDAFAVDCILKSIPAADVATVRHGRWLDRPKNQGLKDEEIEHLKKLSTENKTGCLIAPNFSTGAVLMMMFAQMAAKYFDNAEIIEYHHNQKKDAPSGTAIKTALMMSEAKDSFKGGNCPEKETIEGSRGGTSYSDIQIHSIRMPGFMASQEVLFGSFGQTLSIRHDSTDRKCYMPGVVMAVKHVFDKNDFVYGLENIMM